MQGDLVEKLSKLLAASYLHEIFIVYRTVNQLCER